jgi:hypothetical protein
LEEEIPGPFREIQMETDQNHPTETVKTSHFALITKMTEKLSFDMRLRQSERRNFFRRRTPARTRCGLVSLLAAGIDIGAAETAWNHRVGT